MYKRLVAGILLVLGLTAAIVVPAKADTQDFIIRSFVADYYLVRQNDGVAELRVRERIEAQFPDFDQNHGILRAIPESYDGHGLELSVADVFKEDGQRWNYSTSSENGNTVLKIGDADKYVQGTQVYVIDYAVRGPISFTNGTQRFFWDVNGDQWSQPFGGVTARIHVPVAFAESLNSQVGCYTGSFGSHNAECSAEVTDEPEGKLVTVQTARPLNPGETLTFDMTFANGTFTPYAMSAGEMWRYVGLALLIGVPPLLSLWVVVRSWRKYGRDTKGRGVIVPQYLPPKGVSLLGSSAILHQGFRPSAISATIIDLAVRHNLKVYETGKKMFGGYTYDIELAKEPKNLLPEEEQVIALLFDASQPEVGTRIALDSLSKKVYEKAQTIGSNTDTLMTAQGYFVQNPTKARAPFLVGGGILAGVGFLFPPFTVGLVPAGIIAMIGGAVMAAPTRKGAELKEYLLGVKEYMKLAEADRIKILQSPHGELTEKVDVADKGQLVKLYEKLLPYAMLFGIEKDWAKQFAHLYDTPPDWYSGSGTFNAVYFASALNGLDTTMTQSFTPPSSSGSGAGGGGGGGGGGGW